MQSYHVVIVVSLVFHLRDLSGQRVEDRRDVRPRRRYDDDWEVYQWKAGDWGKCVGHCNYGYQQRTISCVRSKQLHEDVVPTTMCAGQIKPHVERKCNLTACESWYVGEWEECQCPGFVVRPVVCYVQDEIDGLYRVSPPTVCPSPRPANIRPCTPSVNYVCRFVWMTGPWSECSVRCGEAGDQTRLVWCASDSGDATADARCDGALRPSDRRPCDSQPCTNTSWIVSQWSGCRESACDDVESRLALCVADDGHILYNATDCETSLPRPNTSRTCPSTSAPCNDSPRWFTSSWNPCSATCGRGRQTRRVLCLERRGPEWTELKDIKCRDTGDVRPADRQDCMAADNCSRVWLTGPFSQCSTSCDEGLRWRDVYCYDRGQLVSPAECDQLVAPPSSQPCNLQPCHQTVPSPQPAVRDCSRSLYGCCPDDVTEASGPDYAGCQQKDAVPRGYCVETEFGCCSDGVTAARGPFGRGCPDVLCYETEFGCCDDGLTAADGPDGLDCPPSDTPLCLLTLYGCCPDGETPANGPDLTGCDVSDDVTSTTSTASEPCSDADADCSSDDDLQVSSGEVASCVHSTYGCCPDGLTARQSDDDDCLTSTFTTRSTSLHISTSDHVSSELASASTTTVAMTTVATETSSATTAMETTSATTAMETTAHVASVSDDVSWKDDSEAPVTSSATDREPAYTVTSSHTDDVTTVMMAQPTPDEDVKRRERCLLAAERGDNSCMTPERLSWYYDASTATCVQFVYAGCGGNDNRFETELDCRAACVGVYDLVPRGLGVCALPVDPGPCSVPVTRWHYNHDIGRCVTFTFGGCHGNANKFDTKHECEGVCPVQEICKLVADAGKCSNSLMRYFYDPALGDCRQFVYGGCHGNANRFVTYADCETTCKQTLQSAAHGVDIQDLCRLTADVGPCDDFQTAFYYNATLDRCERFTWGGCAGNANRFSVPADCERRCRQRSLIRRPPTAQHDEVCLEDNDPGSCGNYEPKWYFEPVTGVCRRFLYGGCGGNANRFDAAEECWDRCGDSPYRSSTLAPRPTSTLTHDQPQFGGSVSGGDVTTDCQLPVEVGPCFAYQIRWYHDPTSSTCRQFHYGGCQGNANNFFALDDCQTACIYQAADVTSVKPNDACLLPKESGSCFNQDLRFYWDAEVAECRPLMYSGCGGNGNNFATQDDCYAACGRAVTTPDGARRRYRRRRYRPGDCYEAVSAGTTCDADRDGDGVTPRWYFDSEHGNCLAFYFNGCNGNGNNFHSYDDCIALCFKVAEICGLFQCDLQCDLGYARGPAGCLKCECADPCQYYTCADGMECFMDHSVCQSHPCAPKPNCRPSLKPGQCPVASWNGGASVVDVECVVECWRDSDCTGVAKCCDLGCNRTCAQPMHSCASTVFGCCPDGKTVATEWNYRSCPAEAPTIMDHSRQILAVVGSDVIIPCKSRGAPLPTITWYRNGVPIVLGGRSAHDGRLRVNDVSDQLTIYGVRRSDASTYSCRAFNTVGAATRTYTLVVQVPARIVDVRPPKVTLLVGSSASIMCHASGDPSPIVRWLRYDVEIGEDGDGHLQAEGGGLLMINNVTIQYDGWYECEASNGVGPAQRRTVIVDVLGEFSVAVTTPDDVTNFTRDDNVTLLCSVSGDVTDDMHVTWSKDGDVVIDGDRSVVGDRQLRLYDVTPDDSGEYTCEAVRRQQQADASLTITVHAGAELERQQLPVNCTDSPWLANCKLLVQARLCSHPYYRVFCCQSCFEAGQLV